MPLQEACPAWPLPAWPLLDLSLPGASPTLSGLQMDDSKVVSGDGNAVRLWEHATGRRISTLQGHPGRVTCVAFDDSLLVSGCAASVVKLWSMDDLRCRCSGAVGRCGVCVGCKTDEHT